MFGLRFCAHFIETKLGLSPIGILLVSALLAFGGLQLASGMQSFGVACIGSRLAAGVLAPEKARALRDADGITMDEALRRAGRDPNALGAERERLSRIGAFVEGPGFLPHLSGRQNLDIFWRASGRTAST